MSDPRGANPLGRYPGAQFRCLVCSRFVIATAQGVCPRCGYAPPVLIDIPKPPVQRAPSNIAPPEEAPKIAVQVAIVVLVLLLVVCPLILSVKYSD